MIVSIVPLGMNDLTYDEIECSQFYITIFEKDDQYAFKIHIQRPTGFDVITTPNVNYTILARVPRN